MYIAIVAKPKLIQACLVISNWSACLIVFYLENLEIVQWKKATAKIGFQINWSNKKRLNIWGTFSKREKESQGAFVSILIHLRWEQVYKFSVSNDDKIKRENVFKLQHRLRCSIKKEWYVYTFNRYQDLKEMSRPLKIKKKFAWNTEIIKAVFHLEFSELVPQFMYMDTKLKIQYTLWT